MIDVACPLCTNSRRREKKRKTT